ncbi:ABC transporter permease [Desulfocastanea catecholica]
MTTSILEIDAASDDTLQLTLAGEWRLGNVQPSAQGLLDQLKEQKVNRVTFDTNRLDAWDSMLLVFIARISAACSRHNVSMDQSGLPAGVRRLMELSSPRNQRTGITHGAVMAGVIIAGRTGAAYAAQIGTMQVNEEVDALETLGLSPIEFSSCCRGCWP